MTNADPFTAQLLKGFKYIAFRMPTEKSFSSGSEDATLLRSGISSFEEAYVRSYDHGVRANECLKDQLPFMSSNSSAFDQYSSPMEKSIEVHPSSTVIKNFEHCDISVYNERLKCSINYLRGIKVMRVELESSSIYCCTANVGQDVTDQKDAFHCKAEHIGFVEQGTLYVKSKGGEKWLVPGECYVILPGHMCWSGNEGVVLYEFDSLHDRVRVQHPHSEGADFDGVLSSKESLLTVKSFESPDDFVRAKEDMFVTVMNVFESCIMKQTVGKPRASWFEHIRPCLNEHVNCEHVKSCSAQHVGFVKSGRLLVTMDNEDEFVLEAMDCFVIEPGHNALVVSQEDVVMFEFILTE